jgi:ribonuclease-3
MEQAMLVQSADLARLESALDYSFSQPQLLVQALAHRSQTYGLVMDATGKPDTDSRLDNERLEFLGDAVLGLLVSERLFQLHPDWQEGELTRLRAQLVNRQHLAKVAQSIGLGEHIRLSKDIERVGGRDSAYILANALEAVLAAMFLDAGRKSKKNSEAGGSLEPVRRFTRKHVLGPKAEELALELVSGGALGNYKSKLQEHLQAAHAGMPIYRLRSESGPDHRKRFQAEVRVRTPDGQVGDALAVGDGISRKKAEQEAARRALALLSVQEPVLKQEQEPAQV